jgi:2'-5' RNA ligase
MALPPPTRQRLFFALLPPADVRAGIASAAALLAARFAPGGRAIAPEQWHLTLRFLGDFPAGSDAAERARWAGAQVRAAPCALVLDLAASFPGARPPWVLRGAGARQALEGLHAGLCAALAAAGFAPGEPAHAFVPHVTLVRHATQALPPTPIAPIAWPARDFVLLESLPAERRYVERGRWPLAPPSPN